MVHSEHTDRAAAAAHLAITLATVRDTTPDDETLAHIAVEVVADIEKVLPFDPKKYEPPKSKSS